MDTSRKNMLVVEIARLYYEEHKTQEEIARELGISRSTISRCLKTAHAIGAVQIHIVDPYFECSETAEALRTRFSLERAIVVPASRNSEELIKRDIGNAAADYLVRILRDGSILGVSWGTTLEEVVGALRPRRKVALRAVQLVGSLGCSAAPTHANELARRIAELFHGEWNLLPAPAVVESSHAREVLMKEPSVRDILEMGKSADIAVVSIGACDPLSGLVRSGYVTKEEIEAIKRTGAVGDICCRFFDIEGRERETELNGRTISITLQEFRNIKKRVGIAGGRRKTEAILGALRGRWINSLVTDEVTAREVLRLDDSLGISSGGIQQTESDAPGRR